jgi:hypothetical protein
MMMMMMVVVVRKTDRLARVTGLGDLMVQGDLTEELDPLPRQYPLETRHGPKDLVLRLARRACEGCHVQHRAYDLLSFPIHPSISILPPTMIFFFFFFKKKMNGCKGSHSTGMFSFLNMLTPFVTSIKAIS